MLLYFTVMDWRINHHFFPPFRYNSAMPEGVRDEGERFGVHRCNPEEAELYISMKRAQSLGYVEEPPAGLFILQLFYPSKTFYSVNKLMFLIGAINRDNRSALV